MDESNLAWESIEIIRKNGRANAIDYINSLFTDFFELHGDRNFKDDQAIKSGIALYKGRPVTVIAQIKGKNLEENKKTNFSMPHPEGYRKAMRLAKQAEKFQRPIICFVDTPGAYCGIDAEKRGQGEAIASSMYMFSRLKTPIITIILGEGGSGGALALAVCDKLAMLEHTVYSVISPRGCASILWKDGSQEKKAAEALCITAKHLYEMQVCDVILKEGDADNEQQRFATAVSEMEKFIDETIPIFYNMKVSDLLENRYNKFRKIAEYEEM